MKWRCSSAVTPLFHPTPHSLPLCSPHSLSLPFLKLPCWLPFLPPSHSFTPLWSPIPLSLSLSFRHPRTAPICSYLAFICLKRGTASHVLVAFSMGREWRLSCRLQYHTKCTFPLPQVLKAVFIVQCAVYFFPEDKEFFFKWNISASSLPSFWCYVSIFPIFPCFHFSLRLLFVF